MRLKLLLVVLLLPVAAFDAGAQICFLPFPGLSTCSGSECNIAMNIEPTGVAKLFPDNRYGTELAINFGGPSVFNLGDNGKINFGNTGGTQAVGSPIAVCTHFITGLRSYIVDMGNGGWLNFSGNNRMEFKTDNSFILGDGSKIDGRLDIQSDGTVRIVSASNMAMPNVDINAKTGITLIGQDDMQIGTLQNQGTPSSNQGIFISASGDVEIDVVDTNGEFSVTAEGNITIGAIENADSFSLTIASPATGVIEIDGQQTTDNTVMCAPPDDCSDFQLDGGAGGGSGVNDCNTVSSDPNVERPDDCAGGGAVGPGFVLLCMLALYRKYRAAPVRAS